MKRSAGFSLIELLIVVAIVGVLAAIAIPAYTTHLAKAKLVSALGDISNLKTAFQLSLDDGSEVSSVADIGGTSTSGSCSSITATSTAATGQGSIQCVISNGPSSVAGKSITWTRAATGEWSCVTSAPAALAPSSCPGS